ncbi:Bro-N domain-containing protein [Rodentibacter caecimuris]|uniref:BRO-N domain-containing protein n=1 Tax=Rodentibacter caecimuris TaxID=1796644 RepID=UPI000986F225
MTTQIQFQSFNFNSNSVRVITDPNQEFWFCGVDVCNILGYENSRTTIQKHCKQGGVSKRYTPTQSGDQEMIFINEPNLYRLIIKSRKPEAEPFEAWVFEEVLPQIRKTGKYQLEPKQLALPEPTVDREFQQAMIKILNYARQYEQFQRAICTKRGEEQRRQIEFFFSDIVGDDGYLFIFRNNITQDIQRATDMLYSQIIK